MKSLSNILLLFRIRCKVFKTFRFSPIPAKQLHPTSVLSYEIFNVWDRLVLLIFPLELLSLSDSYLSFFLYLSCFFVGFLVLVFQTFPTLIKLEKILGQRLCYLSEPLKPSREWCLLLLLL